MSQEMLPKRRSTFLLPQAQREQGVELIHQNPACSKNFRQDLCSECSNTFAAPEIVDLLIKNVRITNCNNKNKCRGKKLND
eukprot:UN04099